LKNFAPLGSLGIAIIGLGVRVYFNKKKAKSRAQREGILHMRISSTACSYEGVMVPYSAEKW